MNVFQKAVELAGVLDSQGKKDAPIRVRSSRGYMMRLGLRPSERGKPLFIKSHPVIARKMHPTELIPRHIKQHLTKAGYSEIQAADAAENILTKYKRSQIKATEF